jgi:beta-glucanase (GH16 family)
MKDNFYTNENHKIVNKLQQKEEKNTRQHVLRLKLKKKFQYGYFEARANYSEAWLACFWMLGSNIIDVGWPKCGRLIFLNMWERTRYYFYFFTHTGQSWKYNQQKKQVERY